jgi:hypothetical protein
MKVEIMSGNDTGVVKDLPQVEAEIAIQTGFAKKFEAVEATVVSETVPGLLRNDVEPESVTEQPKSE